MSNKPNVGRVLPGGDKRQRQIWMIKMITMKMIKIIKMIMMIKMVIDCDCDDSGNSSEWVSLGDESEDYKDKCDCDSTDG